MGKDNPIVNEELALSNDEAEIVIGIEEVQAVRKERIVLRKILEGFKKFWIWILVALVVALIGGRIYFNSIDPIYIINEKVRFSADVTETGGSPYSATIGQQYIATVCDFIDEDVVIKRANVYYDDFRTRGIAKVDEYIEGVQTGSIPYVEKEGIEEKILASRIAVTYKTGGENQDYFINVKYSDYDRYAVMDMVKIIVLAAEQEARQIVVNEVGEEENKYLGAYITLRDKGPTTDYAYADNDDSRIMTMSAIIGVGVSAGIIVLVCLIDNKVKDKEEIELITGVNLIAYLESQ